MWERSNMRKVTLTIDSPKISKTHDLLYVHDFNQGFAASTRKTEFACFFHEKYEK